MKGYTSTMSAADGIVTVTRGTDWWRQAARVFDSFRHLPPGIMVVSIKRGSIVFEGDEVFEEYYLRATDEGGAQWRGAEMVRMGHYEKTMTGEKFVPRDFWSAL